MNPGHSAKFEHKKQLILDSAGFSGESVQGQERIERCTLLYCHVLSLHLSVFQTWLCLISKNKITLKLIKPTGFLGFEDPRHSLLGFFWEDKSNCS